MSKGIITLCGSTRFKQQFNDVNYWLTINDYIVLSVGSLLHSDNDLEIKNDILNHKDQLDDLHKEKIAMSDAIVVLDVNAYVGDSTKSEIEYAKQLGKPIYWYSSQSYLNLAVSPVQIRRLETAPISLQNKEESRP